MLSIFPVIDTAIDREFLVGNLSEPHHQSIADTVIEFSLDNPHPTDQVLNHLKKQHQIEQSASGVNLATGRLSAMIYRAGGQFQPVTKLSNFGLMVVLLRQQTTQGLNRYRGSCTLSSHTFV